MITDLKEKKKSSILNEDNLINGYPKGSDITIMNTMYLNPRKDPQTGKYDKGSLTVVYKDNVTGEKGMQEIENPEYQFYLLKEDEHLDNNELFIEKSKVEAISTPYTNIDKKVAELTGNMDFYYDNIKNGNRYANKQIHTNVRLFNSDAHIEDHFRTRFSKNYTNNIGPITKSYFDIEADGINKKGDFVSPDDSPVNAITVISDKNNKVYTLLLRNSNNPLIEEFEKSINNDLFDELKGFVRERVGGWKNEIRFGLNNFQYEILFYDEEIDLIADMFKLQNILKPDFILAWNMSFDMCFLIDRIKYLGYNPEDIICHPDFKIKKCQYNVDELHRNELAERGDFAQISSYSVYLDQMIQFPSRRKGQSQFASYKLDYIGMVTTGIRKLDFSHITQNFAKFPYLDYKLFVFYNIMDTIVQKCIEMKANDINYIFTKCVENNTRYHKGHRQTVYLVNRGCKEFYNEDEFIMGNNCNRNNVKEGKFPGALVTDPRKLNDYAKIKLADHPLNLLDNLDDYDYKSLYPSLMREFNIAPNTQIGKVEIPNRVHNKEDQLPSENTPFDRSRIFMEDLQSHVWLEFASRWFHLAEYSELYDDITDYFTNVKASLFNLRNYTPEGKIPVLRFVAPGVKIKPLTFTDGKPIRVIDFYHKPDFEPLKEYFKNGAV